MNVSSANSADNDLFLEYWDIDIVSREAGTIEFSGVLQRDGTDEALSQNYIYLTGDNRTFTAFVPTIHTFIAGAEIYGNFNSDSGEFNAAIEGYVGNNFIYTEISDYYNI